MGTFYGRVRGRYFGKFCGRLGLIFWHALGLIFKWVARRGRRLWVKKGDFSMDFIIRETSRAMIDVVLQSGTVDAPFGAHWRLDADEICLFDRNQGAQCCRKVVCFKTVGRPSGFLMYKC